MKRKILAIDDEKSIRFIVENTFNKEFEVTTLSNGMDALYYIPLIMLSGKEESADKIKCFEMGADDYVVKPFNPKELIVRIKRRIETAASYTGNNSGH